MFYKKPGLSRVVFLAQWLNGFTHAFGQNGIQIGRNLLHESGNLSQILFPVFFNAQYRFD